MDDLVFTTANVVTIIGGVIALVGVYIGLVLRIQKTETSLAQMEKDMTDLGEKVDKAIEVGERTAKSLADVATQLAVLSERVGNLVKLQEAAVLGKVASTVGGK